MKILNMLCCFDKETEFLKDEVEIKNITGKEFKILLNIDDLDGEHPLSIEQLNYIHSKNEFPIDLDKYEYCMDFCGDYTLDLRGCKFKPATKETRKPNIEP